LDQLPSSKQHMSSEGYWEDKMEDSHKTVQYYNVYTDS